MAADLATTPVNWYVIMASSGVVAAVISSVTNIIFNAWQESKRRRREEAKEARRISHVHLEIAFELETWARQLDGYLYRIAEGLEDRARDHDESTLNNLRNPKISFSALINWAELPVKFVANTKALPNQLETTNQWIQAQFAWADLDDIYTLEEESVAYHGLRICKVAADIRDSIHAGQNEEARGWVDHFQEIVDSRKEQFKRGRTHFIPELQAQFNEEFPSSRQTVSADHQND